MNAVLYVFVLYIRILMDVDVRKSLLKQQVAQKLILSHI